MVSITSQSIHLLAAGKEARVKVDVNCEIIAIMALRRNKSCQQNTIFLRISSSQEFSWCAVKCYSPRLDSQQTLKSNCANSRKFSNRERWSFPRETLFELLM